MKTNKLTYERANELLEYDKYSGELIWKTNRGKIKKGDIAGSESNNGNIRVTIDGKKYMTHRISILLITGNFPINDVTNINYVPTKLSTPDGIYISTLNIIRFLKDQKIHNPDGPAEFYPYGYKTWYLYGKEVPLPEGFYTMIDWIEQLNYDEKYSLQFINDIKGLILFIKNPTGKQIRLDAMRWKI